MPIFGSNGMILKCNIVVKIHFVGCEAPSNSWIDSTISPKVKTTEGQGVGAHSLAHSISGVEGHVGVPGWGLGRVTNGSIIHMALHKPNNKLVSA
jgi:hypothetical protein